MSEIVHRWTELIESLSLLCSGRKEKGPEGATRDIWFRHGPSVCGMSSAMVWPGYLRNEVGCEVILVRQTLTYLRS